MIDLSAKVALVELQTHFLHKSEGQYRDQTCFFYALTSAGPRGWC